LQILGENVFTLQIPYVFEQGSSEFLKTLEVTSLDKDGPFKLLVVAEGDYYSATTFNVCVLDNPQDLEQIQKICKDMPNLDYALRIQGYIKDDHNFGQKLE